MDWDPGTDKNERETEYNIHHSLRPDCNAMWPVASLPSTRPSQTSWTSPSNIKQKKPSFLKVVLIRYFVTSVRRVANSENWYQKMGPCSDKPDHKTRRLL